ncbi:hypothetical protein [Clostridium senegalense]|uniref:hypothetical protein n=1 Tax=Clostridium senegalense TaxID=1465809 RepID=UPI000289DBBA|nr:hypothetical protein [Clostridium senegalense]
MIDDYDMKNEIEVIKNNLSYYSEIKVKIPCVVNQFLETLSNLPIIVSKLAEKFSVGIEVYFAVLDKLRKELLHKKGVNIFLVTCLLESNTEFLNIFIKEGLCPPIFYFLKNKTLNDMIKFDERFTENIDIKNLLDDNELLLFYYNSMNEWIEDEDEEFIKEFIREIQINFQQRNVYVTTLNLFTLIEYKVRKSAEITGNPIGEDRITKNIIETLKKNCFKSGKYSQLDKLFFTFFNKKSNYYIYKSTSNNPNFITRHILHGERLDLINHKNMMSLVFLTDCLYKMIIDYPITNI